MAGCHAAEFLESGVKSGFRTKARSERNFKDRLLGILRINQTALYFPNALLVHDLKETLAEMYIKYL